MIGTDSQIGIQRPSAMRRAEQARPSGLVGLVTNHFVAKLLSLVFAGILVMLIDREIDDTLIDADFDVHVGSVPHADVVAGGRRQLILETEAGIAVRFVQPEQVRVTVRGPQKLQEQVKRAMVAVVPIKAEWLRVDVEGKRHTVNRTLVGADASIGVRGVTITIDPAVQVDLDPEVPRDVRLSGVPKDVPAGLVAEVTFEPPTVRVLGAESLFGKNGIDQIAIVVPVSGRAKEFTWQVTQLPEEVLEKYVRMAPDQRVLARVRFTEGAQATFELRDIPIFEVRPPGVDDITVELIGLPKTSVTAMLSGTPEDVAAWKDRQDELRRIVRADINTEKLARKANQNPGTPVTDELDVEIVRLPDVLRLVSVTPARVDVTITTKK